MEEQEAAEVTSSLWDAELERYVLQEVILTSRGVALAPDLYMTELTGTAHRQADRLALAAGSKVGFNTYANSFYASYWERFTELRIISLSGKLEGSGLIHLHRSTPSGQTLKVGEYPVSGIFHIHFDLFSYLPGDEAAGRFFFDLQAETDISVQKIAFSTFSPPRRSVSFSLGICAYRKEKYVSNLALGLEGYIRDGGDALSEVIVVNNAGNNDDLPVLQSIAAREPSFKLLAQDNIGGAGGFARTLHESLKSETSTHHIFMDDDVFFDTCMLDRLRAFVSYSLWAHVVGGQMMNMGAPHMLYEGGAKLDYWGFLERVGDQIDGSDGGEVSFFDQVRDVDYNAWWFACVPKWEAGQIGLPLNIFIRGDDFEYGLRMARTGVSTVSLPGLFIWHEAFEQKSSAWLEHYNWRNRLIMLAIYQDGQRFDIPPVDLLRDFFADCMQAEQYERAFAIARGALAFLCGPEAILTQHAEQMHATLLEDLAQVAYHDAAAVQLLDAAMADMGAVPDLHPMLKLNQSRSLGDGLRSTEAMPWLGHPLVEALERVLARYAADAARVKTDWQARAHDLSSAENWMRLYHWDGM